MSKRAGLFDGIFRKKATPFVCLILLIFLTFLARFLWIQHHEKEFESLSAKLTNYIESTVAKDQRLSIEEIQSILKSNTRVAFFAWENQLENRQLGFLNVKCFDLGASKLAEFYNQHTTSEVLDEIIRNSQQFSSTYLHVRDNPIHRTMSNQKVKTGQYTLGYLVPGYVMSLPQSGGYYDLFYKGWMLFLISNVLVYPAYLRRRKNKSFEFSTPEKNHLEWLERDLSEDDFEEDTTRDEVFSQKPGWTELFNQVDLKDWNIKGEWYARDAAAIGFPWGGSITTKYEIPFDQYEFEVEAMRMVGTEGFAILFQCQGKPLVWMIGGWKNTRSEVIGYESCKTNDTLDKFRWYYVKIESDAEKLVGFLDGRKVWELQKKDVVEPTVDLGFQRGFGVGVWSSMARFQRIRIISNES